MNATDKVQSWESQQRAIARDFHTEVKKRILPWQKENKAEMPFDQQYEIAKSIRDDMYPAGMVSDFQLSFYSPDAVINQRIKSVLMPRIFKYRIANAGRK